MVHKLGVTLEELYRGKTRKIAANRDLVCGKCDGRGGEIATSCGECGGRGIRLVTKQLGPGMMQQMQKVCVACDGRGQKVEERHRCKECKGKRTVRSKKIIEVRPPTM